ncbi:MAG: hypothetical protein K1X72_17890 [Pyrinomonadaceae bacterium]|nr:hypothetical protein [Pyrinomonadaceae bacterium]
MKRITFLTANILLVLFLILTINAQNSDIKVSKAKEKQVVFFVDSFLKNYYKAFDLTKVSPTFFVDDYKNRNNLTFFIEDYDKDLTNDEKFQNYFMLLDLMQITFLEKLKEANFDLEKMYKNAENESDDNFFLSKSMLGLFKKYPKAETFLLKENFSKIKNIADFRDAVQDFRSVLQELRQSISLEIKQKYTRSLLKNKNKLFKLDYGVSCSKTEKFCGGIPDKTKMYYYDTFPFVFLIGEFNGKFKVVQIFPPTD